jgi:hypothetical protein
MAWPLSRIVTFVNNSVPVIAENFLNGVQDWVVNLSLGLVSLKAVVADGAGGAAVTPVAGTVTAGASLGTGSTKDGVAYRDLMPFAAVYVASAGGFADDTGAGGEKKALNVNPANCRTGVGTYAITTLAAPAWLLGGVADNTALFFPYTMHCYGFSTVTFKKVGGMTPVIEIDVLTFDTSNVAADRAFSLVLFP